MSRTYAQPYHIVVRDGDEVRIGNRRFTVAVHGPGPNSDPYASLIPQAVVISAHPLPQKPAQEITYGDVLHIVGQGPHKVMRGSMPEWPRVIPQFGGRFYYRYEGFGQWRIYDRKQDGAVIGYWPKSQDEARAMAASMSAEAA